MTKINRITMQGFKSFAHKTDIPFDDKFNCILGPNGSGKSNLGDAICFVLGRLSAKSLRAEKAANLIFNGGKNKKPSSAAYVEIAFDNSSQVFPYKEKEVVINRTVTDNGNSIYKVNGKKCNRTEAVDLLSIARINPEGYNIILQGDITRFVDMPTLERRKIIEEISDVSIYEEKKHKAILELEHVEEKLGNAEIILKERKTYLNEMKKDRDQALKFRELKDKIDSCKATIVNSNMKEKDEQLAKNEKEISDYQGRISSIEGKISQLKAKTEEHKKEVSKINQEIEKKGEKEQLKVHRELEDLKVSMAEDKTRISALKDEINKINQRKEQFKQEIKDLDEKSSSFSQKEKELISLKKKKEEELKDMEEKIAQFRKKNKIESTQEIDQEIEEKDKLIEKKQEEVQKLRQEQQELLRDNDKLSYQLGTIEERINKVKEVEKTNKQQVKALQQFKDDFKNATLKLNQCLSNDSSYASQLANAKKNLALLQEEYAKLEARARSLLAGFQANQAVKSILEQKKSFKGVYGTIAELGQVKRKYAAALETAASGKMQNIVVDSDKTASDCINYLKEKKLGTASFIPLNKVRYQEITLDDKKLQKQEGVHDFAINLVNFDSQFKKAFANVFGNTLVVDDINTARKVGVGMIKMTTIDGDSISASGVMWGGFKEKRNSYGFREEDSTEELKKVESKLMEAEGVINNLLLKREANEKEISVLRNKRSEMEAEIIKLEKTLHLDTGDLEASSELKKELQLQSNEAQERLSNIQKSLVEKNRELTSLKTNKQDLRLQMSQLRNPRLLAQLSAFEESKQNCRDDLLRIESDLKNSLVKMDQLISPEISKIKEIMKQHDKEEEKFTKEITALAVRVSDNGKLLIEKEKDSKEFYAKYKALFNSREQLVNEVTKIENEIEHGRENIRNHEKNLNLVSLKNAEVKARIAGLQEEFKRYKDTPLIKNKPLEEISKEISKFEVMLGQMSAVNLKALEVYEQIEKEFNSLVEKKGSLEKEKTDVLTLMNEIETKKKEHFLKTFNRTNENFQRIFNSLFKKGKAYLQLDNSDKPFDDGMSIKVKISGNRFMDIKSLSGGEKTLTALSFIFAIQEYQPASFYILDEIDAALDKHNSEQLAKLIRTYANNAQYICISHNDALISEADTLFGVSMLDGVSKVTSLKI